MDMKVRPDWALDATNESAPLKVVARGVNVYYGEKHALNDVSVDIPGRGVMAFIGPSGCGKTTFLRCINRLNDTIPTARNPGRAGRHEADLYKSASQANPGLHHGRFG